MRASKRSSILIISILLLTLLTSCKKQDEESVVAPPPPIPLKPIGKSAAAPDFSLVDMQGKPISLKSYRGKVVVLNFWATWCPPCRKEVPDLVVIQKEYQAKGVEIIGIAMEREGKLALTPFVERQGINYRVALDDGRVSNLYDGIDAIPTTFFIDKKGLIRQKVEGGLSKRDIEGFVNAVLSES